MCEQYVLLSISLIDFNEKIYLINLMFLFGRNAKKYVLPFFFFFLFLVFKIGGNPVGPIFGDGGDMNTQRGAHTLSSTHKLMVR